MRAIYIARLRGIPEGEVRKVVTLPAVHSGSICVLQAKGNVRCCSSRVLWLWQSLRQKCSWKLRDLVALCPFQQVSLCRGAVSSLLRQIFLVCVLTFASTFIRFFCSLTIMLYVLLMILIILFSSSSSADSLVLIINDEKCVPIQVSSYQQLLQLHYYLHTLPGEIFYNTYVM